jgi:glycerol uptake facilitator protein
MRDGPALWQKLIAEGLGTGFLVLFGAGSVTATFTLIPASRGLTSEADFGIIGLSFAIIIAVMVYALGRISGAHLNPAVTVGLAVRNHIDWLTAALYIVVQLVGALIGAFCIAAIFGGHAATSGILGVTSFNQATTSVWQALVAEALGTFVLVFIVYGLAVDPKAPTGWAGLMIGLAVGGVIMVIGPVTGGSINPARTFGPMFAQVWLGGPNFINEFWVYVVAPILGGIAAAFVYEAISTPSAEPTTIPTGEKVAEPND